MNDNHRSKIRIPLRHLHIEVFSDGEPIPEDVQTFMDKLVTDYNITSSVIWKGATPNGVEDSPEVRINGVVIGESGATNKAEFLRRVETAPPSYLSNWVSVTTQPSTIKEATEIILSSLDDKSRRKLQGFKSDYAVGKKLGDVIMPEGIVTILLKVTWEEFLINQFGLNGENKKLIQACDKKNEDDRIKVIIDAVLEAL